MLRRRTICDRPGGTRGPRPGPGPGLALLLALAGPAAAGAADTVVVPAHLDLGEWPAARSTTGSAWLVNAGSSPLRLTRVRADGDGIRLVDFRPRDLPPAGALELRVQMDAPPQEDKRVTRSLTLDFAGRPSVTLSASVRSVHPDLHLPPPEQYGWSPLRAAPPTVDFGAAAPGRRVERSVWLINTADEPLRVVDAKASCGCLEVPGFAAMDLAPARAVEVPLRMLSQGVIGQERFKYVTFLVDGYDPLSIEVRMDIIDPRLARANRYLDAIARDDQAAARTCLALDARIWLRARSGPGVPRDAEGRTPWEGWDRALNTIARHEDPQVGDDSVSITIEKHNDLHRLLETPPSRLRATFWFNTDGEIDGVVYEPEPISPAWREQLQRLGVWADRHRPREWSALRNGAETAAFADRWRALAVEWRTATGAPATGPPPGDAP